MRKTKSLAAILAAFEESKEALSVVELVERFHQRMNKTTVYRILDRLEDEGTVHSFMGRDGLKWYALCNGCSHSRHIDAHPHFQCNDCGKTECLTVDVLIPQIPNHQIDSVNLLLVGKCENCAS